MDSRGNWAARAAHPGAFGSEAPSSTLTSIAAAVTTAVIAGGASPLEDDGSSGECELLGPFALLVQAALGALALLALVYKRWRERPQRPVKIWFFDVSKQVFGSVLVHIANIFMSQLTSGRFSVQLQAQAERRSLLAREEYTPNPCSFYLLNLAIDTTLGIPILILLLRILTGLFRLTPVGQPPESIESGNYGNPPRAGWWLKQSIIYFMGLFGMKLCVLIIFLMMPLISKVGDWALGWTEGNEKLQIAFVMMIFPLIMNALQYYIIDSFIKKRETNDHERLPNDDPDESGGVFDASDFAEDSDSEAGLGPDEARVKSQQGADEYDPDVDGDAPTIVGSSSSHLQRERSAGHLPRELYPKE